MTIPSNNLVTLHIFAEDYSLEKSWKLAQWCKVQGADECSVTVITPDGPLSELFERFDTVMRPFRRPTAQRRHLTASRGNPFVRPAELWQCTSTALSALRNFLPNGIFMYENSAEDWFEDLTLYRKGELMLGVVSHEGEGVLRVTNEEQTLLKRDGFPFRSSGIYVGY